MRIFAHETNENMVENAKCTCENTPNTDGCNIILSKAKTNAMSEKRRWYSKSSPFEKVTPNSVQWKRCDERTDLEEALTQLPSATTPCLCGMTGISKNNFSSSTRCWKEMDSKTLSQPAILSALPEPADLVQGSSLSYRWMIFR